MRRIYRLRLILKLYSILLIAAVLKRIAFIVSVFKIGPRAALKRRRFYNLAAMAQMALKSSSCEKAGVLAEELLRCAEDYPADWYYGNAIHHGHGILGLVSLRQGRIDDARRHLILSGQTPGSPQLNSFGPNMQLAKAVLEAGERDAVIEYFELCKKFWRGERGRLDAWSLAALNGKVPSFGANLRYGTTRF